MALSPDTPSHIFLQLLRFSIIWVKTKKVAPLYVRNSIRWPANSMTTEVLILVVKISSLGRAILASGPVSLLLMRPSVAKGPLLLAGIWGILSSSALVVWHIDHNLSSSVPSVHTGQAH